MGHGEKRAFLHAQTAKDHGKISLKCILRGARADREGAPDWREQGRFGLAAHQAGTGQVRLANHAIN